MLLWEWNHMYTLSRLKKGRLSVTVFAMSLVSHLICVALLTVGAMKYSSVYSGLTFPLVLIRRLLSQGRLTFLNFSLGLNKKKKRMLFLWSVTDGRTTTAKSHEFDARATLEKKVKWSSVVLTVEWRMSQSVSECVRAGVHVGVHVGGRAGVGGGRGYFRPWSLHGILNIISAPKAV